MGHIGITMGLFYAVERLVLRGERYRFDYRYVLVGALLPDLIDKPLSLLGLTGGRAFSHTMLFACLVTAVSGFGPRRVGLMPGAVLSLGLWTHLLLDMIWEMPGVFLWPALGFAFPVYEVDPGGLLHMLLTNPYIYGGEIVGSIMVLGIVAKEKLFDRTAFRRFLSRGLLG